MVQCHHLLQTKRKNMNIDTVFVLNQAKIPNNMQVFVDNIPNTISVNGTVAVSNMAEPTSYDSQLDSLVTIGVMDPLIGPDVLRSLFIFQRCSGEQARSSTSYKCLVHHPSDGILIPHTKNTPLAKNIFLNRGLASPFTNQQFLV